MEDSIIIFIAIALVFGSFLRDSYKRRNRRANPTRHRRQRRWGGPYSAGETGGGYDERDQGGDWGSGDWGGGDWGGGGGSGDGGGGDSGGGGSD